MNRGTNPVALGLVLVGAALVATSTFLPLSEPTGLFRFVQQNTLIQHGGWILLVAAIGMAVGALRVAYGSAWWGTPLCGSGVIALGIAWWATHTSMRTLYPIGLDGQADPSQPGVVADHGIAIYVAALGVALAIVGSVMLKPGLISAGGSKKQCPDCAEQVLEAAQVCKHCGFHFAPEWKSQAGSMKEPELADPPTAMRRVRCHACSHVQSEPMNTRLTTCEKCGVVMKLSKRPKPEQPKTEQPKKIVVCPDCDAEQKIPATAARFTCGKCKEVFTAPN